MAGNRLASDLDNPEFTGAVNPDSRLAVQFYSRPVQNEFESDKQGRPIFTDMDYVKIFVPGDATTVVDTAAREDHKKRFPLHWAHFQNTHGGDSREIGTPLSQWPRLGKAQVEELRAMKFFTVEAIANAADVSLQNMGMVAGMSPFAFRDHARRFLQVARGDAVAQEAEQRAKALEEENARLKKAQEDQAAAMAVMQGQMAELLAKPTKRKYTKKTAGIVE